MVKMAKCVNEIVIKRGLANEMWIFFFITVEQSHENNSLGKCKIKALSGNILAPNIFAYMVRCFKQGGLHQINNVNKV